MSPITAEMKAKAEVYYGNETCRDKVTIIMAEIGLPDALLLTLQDMSIEECGFVKEIGFVWLKHKKKREHRLDNILVCYDTEISAYIEPNKIRNLRGVKAREFMIWINLSEICVEDSPARFITFKTTLAGLSRSFPASLFGSSESEVVAAEILIGTGTPCSPLGKLNA